MALRTVTSGKGWVAELVAQECDVGHGREGPLGRLEREAEMTAGLTPCSLLMPLLAQTRTARLSAQSENQWFLPHTFVTNDGGSCRNTG